MEAAVIVERGSCDVAENRHNRELMAYYNDGCIGAITDNLLDSLPRPFSYVRNTLTARDGNMSRLLSPRADKIRVVGMDLAKCQALELSVVQFTEIAANNHFQSMIFADGIGSLDGPFQVA